MITKEKFKAGIAIVDQLAREFELFKSERTAQPLREFAAELREHAAEWEKVQAMPKEAILPGTFVRCMCGHYYACTRGDEECPTCARVDSLKAELDQLRTELRGMKNMRNAFKVACDALLDEAERLRVEQVARTEKP